MEPQNKRDEGEQPKAEQNQNQMQDENDKKQDEAIQIANQEGAEAEPNGQAQEEEEQEGEENDNDNDENEENNESNQNEQIQEEPKQEKGKQHISINQEPSGKKINEDVQEQNQQQAPAQPQKMIPEQSMSPEKPKGPKKKASHTQQKPHHAPQQINPQPTPTKKIDEVVSHIQAPPQPPVHQQIPHEKPVQISIPFQSQRYINTLETKLKNKQAQLQTVTQNRNSLQAKVLTLQAENKQVKSTQLLKIQQVLQLSKKQKTYQKQIENLKQNVESLNQQLRSYREIGDIKAMQRRIEELQVFVQRQKDQIIILKTEQEGGSSEGMQQKSDRVTVKEYIKKMDELQDEKDELEIKLRQLSFQLEKKDSENKDYTGILNQIDKELKEKMEKIAELQENIASERSLHLTVTHNLQQKIKSLEMQLAGNSDQSQSLSKQEQEQRKNQQLNQSNSKSQLLKMEQQKQIIFREFLKIELENKALQQTLKQLKNKYQQICKDLRSVKKQMVSKKDYDQILIRYKKCRACLENSIKQNKILRNHRGTENSGEMDQGQMEERNVSTGLLNEEQNNIKKFMQAFNSHVEESVVYLKNTNNIMQNIHFEKYTQEIKARDKKIKEIEDKNSRLEKLNTIFQRELLYKNTIMDRLAEDLKNLRKQYNNIQQQKLSIQGNLVQNVTAKSALKRLEVKAANLLIRNRKIVTEKQNWKTLYEQLKEKYEFFIARDPNFNGQQQPQTIVNQVQQKQKYLCEQGQIQDENTANKPVTQVKPITATTQTQTQGLNQLYYKQIKQTLSAVKKFPELIKNTTANYEKVGRELDEYKKRYDQMTEKYNIKHRALNSEKQANDSWREQAKRQIIGEFQDIRDLVESDRLLICLKKAKCLIEFLEQGEEGEEGQAK